MTIATRRGRLVSTSGSSGVRSPLVVGIAEWKIPGRGVRRRRGNRPGGWRRQQIEFELARRLAQRYFRDDAGFEKPWAFPALLRPAILLYGIYGGVTTPTEFVDLDHLLHDMRLFKSRSEVAVMRKAARIAAAAHRRAMRACRPGLNEAQIHAELVHEYMSHQCEPAYPPIVGGGANACVLHYIDNNQPLEDGDLLLIDAGGDTTRNLVAGGLYALLQHPQTLEALRGDLSLLPGAREELLRFFVAYTPVAVAMCDLKMNYVHYSRRWITDFALPDEDLIGRNHYDVFDPLPERWKTQHYRCLHGETITNEEEAYTRPDGSVEWVRRILRPWRTHKGTIGGIIILAEVTTEKKLAAIRRRRSLAFRKKDVQAVARIIEDVRRNGDKALLSYTRKFDAPRMNRDQIKVPAEAMQAAAKSVNRRFKTALNRAVRQIEAFHRQQFRKSWIDPAREGVLLGQVFHPVDSAGIYVPGGQGGQTPLVSSVLMGALPARIAGVPRRVMVTPPTRDGEVNPHLLAAAHACGIDTVYRVGSAWAIAALAYGTGSIAPPP